MKSPVAFVVDPEPKVWWPVRVSLPIGGRFQDVELKAYLRVYSEEEYSRLLPQVQPATAEGDAPVAALTLAEVLEKNAVLFPQFIADWDGVVSPDGTPLPISTLPDLVRGPYGKAFSVGINRAINEVRYGIDATPSASEGNSAPSPGDGSSAA
ncbi:MAG: hypothetical protein JSS57_16365 [Proteobacteria bacterium]|nr:hypothetical protein [Pseudomonadota bacterium]